MPLCGYLTLVLRVALKQSILTANSLFLGKVLSPGMLVSVLLQDQLWGG